jgi:alpha-L-fucosidase
MERTGRLGFNESGRKNLTSEDVRFTAKHNTVYAFVMGWPAQKATIKLLASNSPQQPGKIRNVEMLGHKGKLQWKQDEAGLSVDMPSEKPCDHAVTLKIVFA